MANKTDVIFGFLKAHKDEFFTSREICASLGMEKNQCMKSLYNLAHKWDLIVSKPVRKGAYARKYIRLCSAFAFIGPIAAHERCSKWFNCDYYDAGSPACNLLEQRRGCPKSIHREEVEACVMI